MTYFSYPIRRLILLCITAFSLIGCIQNGERIDLGRADSGTCTPEACGDAPLVMPCENGEGSPLTCETQQDGTCGWTVGECEETCTPEACGDAPLVMPCENGDGPDLSCETQQDGTCGWTVGACEIACEPADCGPRPTLGDVGVCPGSLGPFVVCEADEAGVCAWQGPRCPDPSDPCDTILCERGSQCIDGECVDVPCGEDECGPIPPVGPLECVDGSVIQPVVCERNDDGICELRDQVCEEDEERCEPGEPIPAGDGCNFCVCPESGLVRDRFECEDAVCEAPCSSNEDCDEGSFCFFGDGACGVLAGEGTCESVPEICPTGGAGVCGCDGSYAFNSCELAGAGVSASDFGGCGDAEPMGVFACGQMTCDRASERCVITLNDIVGENEPPFFAQCEALPEGCAQGDCDCMAPEDFGFCHDGTGNTMIFYPGG